MRTRSRLGLLLALLAVTFSARAEILINYVYTDPYGVEKAATATTPAINPQGDLRLALAGGLDRYVRIAFVDASGTVITAAESERLGPADRIEVDGQAYYGARLVLTPPAGDGNHRLRAEILDAARTVLSHENIPVQIDRTPPIMTGGFGWKAWRPGELYPLPDNTLIGAFEARRFWAEGIQDAHSGLDTARGLFQSVYLEGAHAGQVAYETPAIITEETVAIGNGGNWDLQPGVHYPAADGAYSFRFIIFDQAGNAATFALPVVLDGVVEGEALEFFAVFDPDVATNPVPGSPYSGYTPYVPGMVVKTNPVKMLLRVPRALWWQDNPTGISFYRRAPALPAGAFPLTEADFVDEAYAYLEMAFPYVAAASLDPAIGLSPDYRVASLTWWGAGPALVPDLVLTPGANDSPRMLEIQLQWASGTTQVVQQGRDTNRNTPDTLTGIRVTAEPRAYDQTFNADVVGTCVIPAGATQCTAAEAFLLGGTADGMQMELLDFQLTNRTGELFTPTIYHILTYDGRPPVVESLEITTVASQRQVGLTLTEYLTGSWWALVHLKAVWLEATGVPGDFRLPATRLESTDGVLWWQAVIPLGALPSGVYNLTVYAEDNYGNRSLAVKKTGYVHDATPPVVKIRGPDAKPLAGTVVGGLAEITFTVTDNVDADPVVNFVRITGGPAAENVAVGFYAEQGIYRIEYPVMPPSAAANDYQFEVDATDAAGNHVLAVAPFTFQPAPLRLIAANGDTIALPVTAGSGAVRLPNGHWPLTTEPVVLHTAGGQPLRGRHDLLVRLSADAPTALQVDGQTLTPGGEIRFAGYDFGATDSVLTLPLAWADAAATIPHGYAGQVSVEILQDGAPLFTADLRAWEVGTEVTYYQSEPVYAAKVEEATLAVLPLSPGYCAGTVVTHDPAQGYYDSRGQEGDSVCAVAWTTVPAGLAGVGGQQARLRGYLDVTGATTTVAYQPGLLIKHQGHYAFYPTGAAAEHTLDLITADPPVISFTPTGDKAAQVEWLGAGEWPTWLGRSNAGTFYARGSGAYKGVGLVVTDVATGEVVIDQLASSVYARAPLFTALTSLEDAVTLQVRAFYARAPEIAAQATYRFVVVPERSLIRLQAPSGALNTEPLVMQGQFGVYHQRQIEYSAARMGEWAIRVYREVSGGDGKLIRQQVGSETTQLAADGAFSLNLGLLAAGGHRLVATATYLGDGVVAQDVVESTPLGIRVNDGTPVVVTMNAMRDTARPPFLNIIRAVLSNPYRALDVDQVGWERSRDGVAWETIARDARLGKSFGLNETITTSGSFWYRATTRNRYTGATYTAEPLRVQAYERPAVTISGALQTFVDHPVSWSATVTPAERAVVHEWTVQRGARDDPDPLTATGASVSLPADRTGTWYATLRSRFADAPDVPDAWSTSVRSLKVSPPSLSRPKIIGEASVEIGRPYTYSVQVYALAAGQGPADLTVDGEWVLPDGSLATGTTLAYIPTAAEAQVLRYRAWVSGYRAETETTTTLQLRPWAYVFPSAQFHKNVRREFDPAVVTYTLRLTGARTGTESPGVHWTFPPEATVEQHSDTRVTLTLTMPGSYPVAARVFDTRGHEVRLEDTFTVPEPDPLVASAAIQIADSWARAPASVTLRWYADGLLAKERVAGVRLTLNGELISEAVKSYYTVLIEQAGSYDLRFDLETSYGRTVSHSDRFELITGTPPACALTAEGDAVTVLQLRATCTTPMGKLASYHWLATYADAPASPKDLGQKSAHTVRFTAEELARGLVDVSLTAVNDKGQASNTARWTP